MTVSKFDSRQVKNVAALPQVGSSANDTLNTILPQIDAELSKLFEDRNLLLVDGGTIAVNAGATSVTFSASLKLHVNSLVAGGSPKVIDLGATTRAFSSDGNMLYAIINRTAATASMVADSATLPAQTSANQEIVLIAKRVGTTIYFRDGAAIPAGRTVSLGTSDLYGSLGSITNQLVKTSGTDGKTLQGTGITVDASNNVTGIVSNTVQTNIVTGVNAESIATDSATTGSNATIATPTTPIIRLTNVSLTSLDGIPAGIAGQQITLVNDTATTILLNNDTGATTTNRIYTGLSKPLSLKNTAAVLLKYDTVISRWRIVGGSGSGSGSGSTAGGELADLMFSAAVRDSFTDILNGTTPTDVTAGKTDATIFDIANELMKMSYDASKTVTGTGTAMTISATPSFTIKVGDVLVVNGEARKISAISSQTSVTIESAFTTNPTAAAVCISQAVHTVDLNNFTNGGLGLSAASQYSGNIDEIMLGYQDSTTVLDIIPDFGTAAAIAFSASTDASNWTTTRTRVASLSESEAVVTCPTSNPNLYLRFFANKTTGSGSVNLLGYKVFFQKILGQTAGAAYYTAFARPTSSIAQNCSIGLVSGKTRFTFTFPYTRGLNSAEASGSVLEVIANGQVVPRYTSGVTDDTQAYFKEINDNTIEMDTDYSSAGIDFQFKVQRVGIIDTNTLNTAKVALHDDLLDQSIDAQVVPSFLTAVNGAPTSSQFRSDITGRANIPNLGSMLSVQMGPQRMMTQEIYQLQSEFGPTGQIVWGAANDKFNQIRFVGSWGTTNGASGQLIGSTVTNDYMEIAFYGTGLNILTRGGIAADLRASVDGASEGSNIVPASTSGILDSRNYSSNVITPVTSGLSLGMHTVKIRLNAAVNTLIFGFEVLTETTSLRVTPGNVVKGKYKNSLSALSTVAYDTTFESGTLGTKGGCVLVYLKNDGTIAKAVTPTDTTALYTTNTSHVNEEVIRSYNWREFGCGTVNDFSLLQTTGTARAFTLDDGTTTLTMSNASWNTVGNSILLDTTSSSLTITFIGTGLDIMRWDSSGAGNDTVAYTVDGVLISSIAEASGQNVRKQFKICSGLPYGTHTVKIAKITQASFSYGVSDFIIYAPKKPTLPTGSIELAQYYKMANYVANSTLDLLSISAGTIRKSSLREMNFVGTWDLGNTGSQYSQYFLTQCTVAGGYVEYTFFGTGFDYRYSVSNTNNATAVTVSVDGSTNLSSFTSSFYGGQSFNSATGVLNQNPASSSTADGGLNISGLSLGKHTVRITYTSGNVAMRISAFDIITPIHAPTLNGPYIVQNTLSLGNNGFLDLRKFNKRDLVQSNMPKVAQAVGVAANFSTTSTALIPCPDMSVTYYSEGEMVSVDSMINALTTVAGQAWSIAIYVNGISILNDVPYQYTAANSHQYTVTVNRKVFLPKGHHKIDLYWKTSGSTLTSGGTTGNFRQLTVTKLGNS